MPYISLDKINELSTNLTPGELAIYIVAKALEEKGGKVTGKSIDRVLNGRGNKHIKALKKRGLLPKGRIEASSFDGISSKRCVVKRPQFAGARTIVSALAGVVKNNGGVCDGRWWGLQMKQAANLVAKADVTIDEWLRIIAWGGTKSPQYFVSVHQLPTYRERYHIAFKDQKIDARRGTTMDSLWDKVTNR